MYKSRTFTSEAPMKSGLRAFFGVADNLDESGKFCDTAMLGSGHQTITTL